jgi:hypothetical protein
MEAGMAKNSIAALVAMGLTTMLMAGCHVDEHKNGDGDNVKIETPFGGLQVRTNDAAVLQDIGLPAYPGAQVVKKDKDDGSADVNMSFGSFHLGVKAASYRTSDSPDKVEAFYRNELKRYGDVIKCQNEKPVGTPTRTFDEHPDRNALELRTGSEQRQRIVEIEPDGGGTKIGMVLLDLPKGSSGEENDDTRQ